MTSIAASIVQPYIPRLARRWWLEDADATFRSVDGTLVFVDVSGFTAMSERLARKGRVGAEEVTDVIDSCFGHLLADAYAYQGSLLKFGGDALLLLFDGEQHEVRAAAAALDMRHTLSKIGRFETSAGKVHLRMSVGIHSDRFDFFLVGNSHRELIVAGPAASHVVAMETGAGAGRIVTSTTTAAALPESNIGSAIGGGRLLTGRLSEVLRSDPRPDDMVDETLDQLVPASLRAAVTAGVELEHRPATVAFVQFSGVDSLIEYSGAGLAAKAINELVEDVQTAIAARDVSFLGSDIAHDGGKIILTAGAPLVSGNDEEQMLLALRSVAEGVRTLPVRIGVTRGHVFAGSIGPSYRRTYTVMGDVVNLAARLMANADAGQILTTAEVLSGSRTTFATTALEPFSVKGKSQPVQAHAVGEPTGSRGQTSEAGLPLIGRDAELGVLLEAWAAAQLGSGAMVEVAADAGMGKTRLLDELLARTAGTVHYTAECRLYQSSTPYFPFRLLLRHALGLAEDESAGGRLTELIADRAPHLLPWASLIGMPLDIAVDESDDVRALEDEFRRARLEEAVVDLLSNVLTAPVVLTIEDTHWMDEASRDLLARMSSVVGERPWLVILTRRPGDDGFSAARDAVTATTLALAPLGVDAAAAIVNAATADTPLMSQQVHALAERAQGNPLFVIELLDALRRGEDVDSLPHSVEGLIQARIDRLPPADRSLLRDVSVLGTGFQVEHADAVLPEGLGLVGRRVLRRLAGFLSISQTGWVQFRHALIRDVAYQSLPYRTRRELHARVGDSIYRDAGEHPEAQADLLSLHYYAAKRWREAWEYGRVAGDNARGIYANLEAATFYRRAVTASRYLGDVGEATLATVLESLGDALGQAGLYAEAVDAYRKAGERVADDVARAGLLYKRAQTRARTGSYAQALRETTIGHRLLERAGDRPAREARARLTAFAASVRASQGRYREALLLAEEAKAEAESAGEKAALARAYATLDDALEMLGKPDDAVYLPMALAIYEELGDLANVAGITNNLGVRANSVARWDEAIDYYRTSEETWRRVGDDAAAAFVQVNLGELLVSRGQVEEAAEILGEALRVLRAHNDENVAFAQIQWGRLALERGDLVGAVTVLDQARDGAAAAGQLQVAYEATLYLGAARVKQGDAGGALDLVNQLDRSRLSELLIPILSLVTAQALLKLGRREQAAEVAAEGISYARRLGMPYEEARLLNVEARSIGPAGSEPDTVLLRESTRLLVALGCRRG